MGRGPAVRRGTLDPVFEGSNPSAPANSRGLSPWPSGGASRRLLMGDPFMATGFGELKVFSGSAHPELTREIAAFLGVQLGQARLRRFPGSEGSFPIGENIPGTGAFILPPTCKPVRQHPPAVVIM